MKKIIALLLVLTMLLGFAACGNKAEYALGNVYSLSNVLTGSLPGLDYSDEEVGVYEVSGPVSISMVARYEASKQSIVEYPEGAESEFVYYFAPSIEKEELENIVLNYYKALRINEDLVPFALVKDGFDVSVIKDDIAYCIGCEVSSEEPYCIKVSIQTGNTNL